MHEVKGHEERISAIAREYAKSPESTLVVSPDNRSRTEINQRIHDELQSRGVVSQQEHSINTLVPRQEMTGADRSWAQQYQVNDILRYSRSSQETGIEKGEYTRVVSVNARENTLTVLRTNGEQTTYDPRRQMGVSVYREQEKAFSVGDRIQFTAPSQELKIANRELGTVEGIAPGWHDAIEAGQRAQHELRSAAAPASGSRLRRDQLLQPGADRRPCAHQRGYGTRRERPAQ